MKALLGTVALLVVVAGLVYALTNTNSTQTMETNQATTALPTVTTISHASLVLKWGETTVYADPVGAAEEYAAEPRPDIILVTHEHGDHFSTSTIEALMGSSTTLVVPQSVADQLPQSLKNNLVVMENSDQRKVGSLTIVAIPAYNLRPEALKFHPKGRDNGYIVSSETARVYIAGDTEDTPEMRSLQNIDIAFLPMNLPYTMTIDQAASATLAFKPKQVYPYHYRGSDGLSDVAKFKQLVNAGDPSVDVVLGNWYTGQ